jgi:hypothetical protein
MKRFAREAEILASVEHENIVTIYAFKQPPDEQPYIVMRLLQGRSLKDALRQTPSLTITHRIEIVRQVLTGLAFSHSKRVIHRDIKPSNIFLDDTGVKIIDFGIAHREDTTTLRAGGLIGTVNYMSPEQAEGRELDGRSDLFSVGSMLYELIVGKPPFAAPTAAATLYQICHREPDFAPLVDHSPLIPIVRRALEKDPTKRYPSAEEFREDLAVWLPDTTEELPDIAPEPVPKRRRIRATRRRSWWPWLSRRCPLCGERGTYQIRGSVGWFTLVGQLSAHPQWLRSHGLNETAGVPMPPDVQELREELVRTHFPPLITDESSDGAAHHRCRFCASLLPPQFTDDATGNDVAIAVAGAVAHGKTTWLIDALLSPPNRYRYEIVRPGTQLLTASYDFVEPYTVQMLQHGFRASLDYQLFGTTVFHEKELTQIRTLDIRGELFSGVTLHSPNEVILRHLGAGTGSGWLLVVDQFAGVWNDRRNDSKVQNIAVAYERLAALLEAPLRGINKAVVWTFIDYAQWTAEAAQWLQTYTPSVADRLIAIGETTSQPDASLQPFLDFVDAVRLDVLTKAVERISSMLDASLLNGLVALLFRLQILYTLRTRNMLTTKIDYLIEHGHVFVEDCQAIARALYLRDQRSAMGDYVRGTDRDEWVVFPCGRFDGQSVWADQILIEVLTKA